MISKFCRAAALLASLAFAPFASHANAADPTRAPIVILISVDGLAAYNFEDPLADIPTLRWMAANGARAQGMQTVFPSVTWPTHTTPVTSVV